MHHQTIRFIRRGAIQTLDNVPPDRTLLDLLREDLACTGTKEGCGEGDCGACTVVLAEPHGDGLRFRAVNSCIRLAHSIDGMALWTVEDLAGSDGALHPAQEAMVRSHGSQCGFCTPGFVMSLFGMYQNHVVQGRTIDRALAQQELSGNLCRCTGYRPILDAAQAMARLPRADVAEGAVLAQLQQLARAPEPAAAGGGGPAATPAYLAPRTLDALLQARAQYPEAQVVAGCTDVGLWVTKQHRRFDQVLDVTRAAELRRIERYPHHVAIGAAVPLHDAYAALAQDRPQLQAFASRFAGLPVRNSGTLGGNVANGSPIGDSMPLLIALGTNVVLMSTRGHREMPLEALYTGYRSNVMAADELLAWIKVPLPVDGECARVYKISKRFDDDISAICLAVNLRIDGGRVVAASIGVGGVAATPVRARRAEAALTGVAWSAAAARQAGDALRSEFQPISDMRASAGYRSTVLGNLMHRFWLESQGMQAINLESFAPQGEAA
ncbi:MAG: xanthine dehydrogenase small subunit [Rhodoferax sp.]|nr:xanthine dehydrogenase small subunit [Rhodoferax sp.]MCW5641048.1 xanthine dehydrogenase small subunit [Rhodoferax sp.]